MRYRKYAAQVQRVFRRLDRQIAAFQKAAQLRCSPGCGECCRSPEVEATVLEMLPAGLRLWQTGRLQEWLDRLSQKEMPEVCIFFIEHPAAPAAGHCSVYPWRPLSCRLFGFSAMVDREGCSELVSCRLIKQDRAQVAAVAAEAVRRGAVAVPLMREYAMGMYRLDPSLGSTLQPINLALRQALERIGFHLQHMRGLGLR